MEGTREIPWRVYHLKGFDRETKWQVFEAIYEADRKETEF